MHLCDTHHPFEASKEKMLAHLPCSQTGHRFLSIAVEVALKVDVPSHEEIKYIESKFTTLYCKDCSYSKLFSSCFKEEFQFPIFFFILEKEKLCLIFFI